MTMTDNLEVNISPKSARAKSDHKNLSSTTYRNSVTKHAQSGFTLIEIMVVIVILAILAGLVVPKVVGQSDKARVKTTETALASFLKICLLLYIVD